MVAKHGVKPGQVMLIHGHFIRPEQAQRISPMRSILDTGLHATSHTDAPVALPNLMQVAWATVNRTSRSGRSSAPTSASRPTRR